MGHGLCHRRLKELVAKEDVLNKWKKTSAAQRMDKMKNKRLSTDLERWRVQHNRRQVISVVLFNAFLFLHFSALDAHQGEVQQAEEEGHTNCTADVWQEEPSSFR